MHDKIKKIGKHTYGHEILNVWDFGEGAHIEIGNFCSIACNVQIFLGGNHNTDWITTFPFGHTSKEKFNTVEGKGHPKTNGNVIIGNDVWIGQNSVIMSGVKIGDGVVIANNSHVVKDAEPYSIIGGNPAKIIRKRFSDEHIEFLLSLKWWNWPDEKINEYAPFLCSPDFIKLKEKLKSC